MIGRRSVRLPRLLRAAACAVAALVTPFSASAQGVHAEVGHLLERDGWTSFRLGIDRTIVAPIGVSLFGIHLRDQSLLGRRHWGGGADLVLLRGRSSGPYLVGGVAAGFSSDSLDDWWHSWSAGGGYQLVLGGALALAGEARWRSVSPDRRDGLELSVRLGALFGGRPPRARRTPTESAPEVLPPPGGAPSFAGPDAPLPPADTERSPASAPSLTTVAEESRGAATDLADSVVATALQALGASYRLGGTTTDGFDCSGLIQHAYATHGIKLPRVSRDQAREGEPVKRDLEALRPGDILTFSQRGGRVTHVGLYLGDGRFVHSARRGVQVSTLSSSDPHGRWYWKRWVGARRIVTGDE
ncbi:MAG TPA: NlpC/P60 family protein [Gemmatimonadales bacterium]|nr:NlpC/P60 family protein [Gemmatimonadales bacterium]